ncbi:MAG: hypothetical protein DRJ28_08665 [Actinobacteria bacterium]|nr:MAG: hypothetical protein DRJ28_08665 [Actinomycetota bacterium]
MIIAIVLGVVAFLIVAAMLSRQSTKNKKRAVEDLEKEMESVGTFDIFELVESEVRALGLTDIEGAPGIPHAVLLKTWSDNQKVAESCHDRAHLRYVVAAGIDPSDATDDDVTLECTKPKMEDN